MKTFSTYQSNPMLKDRLFGCHLLIPNIKLRFSLLNSNQDRLPNSHVMRLPERHEISYHYLSTNTENKREEEILQLVQDTDFLVLARYMQNAFEMATFIWSLWGLKQWSCFMKNHAMIVIRLTCGVVVSPAESSPRERKSKFKILMELAKTGRIL